MLFFVPILRKGINRLLTSYLIIGKNNIVTTKYIYP